MNRLDCAESLIRLAKTLLSRWPNKVEKGGLRDAMGLDPEKPLQEQASVNDVVRFFEDGDKSERGMVMFAVNSNQDNDFWQDVYEKILSK